MNPEKPKQQVTSKNYIIASVWGAIVLYLTREVSGLGVVLIKFPVLGVPWLYWHLQDAGDHAKDMGSAVTALFVGGLLTILSVIPWVLVYAVIK